MSNPIPETIHDLNSDPENDPQQLKDDELEIVSGGLLPGGAIGDGGVCVNS